MTWKVYYAQVAFALEFKYVRDHQAGHVFPIQQYYDDAKAGALPQVSFIDPIFEGPTNVENDEHPSSNVQVGERFVRKVVESLFRSPDWASSACSLPTTRTAASTTTCVRRVPRDLMPSRRCSRRGT